MNRKKRKPALILLVAVLCAIVLLGIRGTRKTIDKTVPARVCEDNRTTYAPSSITISGTLKKTWSSTSFVGTFAMDGYEPSCRDGVEARINWGDNEYPILTFLRGQLFTARREKHRHRQRHGPHDGHPERRHDHRLRKLLCPHRSNERQLTVIFPAAFAASGGKQAKSLPCRIRCLRQRTGPRTKNRRTLSRPPPAAFSARMGRKQAPAPQTLPPAGGK